MHRFINFSWQFTIEVLCSGRMGTKSDSLVVLKTNEKDEVNVIDRVRQNIYIIEKDQVPHLTVYIYKKLSRIRAQERYCN